MNCNKCGTPILPGENACRFCGTVGDYSKRNNEEIKPEIIDFTMGEDDVVIIDDEATPSTATPNMQPTMPTTVRPVPTIPSVPAPTPVVREPEKPIVDIVRPVQSIPVTPVSTITDSQLNNANNIVNNFENTTTIPVVTPIIAEPAPLFSKPVEPAKIENSENVEQILKTTLPTSEDVLTSPVKEDIPVSIPLAGETAVSASTPIVITNSKEKEELPKTEENIVPEMINEKKSKKEGHGLFNILTFILIVLLIASVITICFLLMGNGKTNKEKDTTSVVSTTNQTIYFNGYKVEIPSNWITVTNKDANYITVMDNTQDWAFTINVAANTDASTISTTAGIDSITKNFGTNKYLFTSDYSKVVSGKSFYIFKGKYYDYSVYVITLGFDSTNTAVADLKFKGEVDDDVLNSVLTSLTTLSVEDLTSFYNNDFTFGDITPIITNSVSTITTTTKGNN